MGHTGQGRAGRQIDHDSTGGLQLNPHQGGDQSRRDIEASRSVGPRRRQVVAPSSEPKPRQWQSGCAWATEADPVTQMGTRPVLVRDVAHSQKSEFQQELITGQSLTGREGCFEKKNSILSAVSHLTFPAMICG